MRPPRTCRRRAPAQAGHDAALVIEGLVSGYGGGDVLHGVSLSVPGGDHLRGGAERGGQVHAAGHDQRAAADQAGTIRLHGESLTGKTPRQILDLGLVHVQQNHSLFRDMTVRENVELGGYILRNHALLLRRRAHVEEMFPQVAQWAGQKAGSLSGGQQRLVEFARCLMLDPSLVLLDEPSMGLSPKVLRTVFDAARLMNAQGKTILLVEQNARAGLRLSARGIVLENGRVRLAGSGREILEHPEIGALYLGGAVPPAPPAAAAGR